MGLVVGVLRGLSGRAAWAFDGMHGLSVLRRRAPIKHVDDRLQKHVDDRSWGDRVPPRAFFSTGLDAFGVERQCLFSGEWQV